MPLLVRFRPNASYLRLFASAALLVALGVTTFTGSSALRIFLIAGGGVLLALLGPPVILSTVFRVPILVVDDNGVRLPMAGARLAWADIARVTEAPGPRNPVLLIVPADAPAALRQMRPWLRAEGRKGIARYGSPLVIAQELTDSTHAEIQSAVAHFCPSLTGALTDPTGR